MPQFNTIQFFRNKPIWFSLSQTVLLLVTGTRTDADIACLLHITWVSHSAQPPGIYLRRKRMRFVLWSFLIFSDFVSEQFNIQYLPRDQSLHKDLSGGLSGKGALWADTQWASRRSFLWAFSGAEPINTFIFHNVIFVNKSAGGSCLCSVSVQFMSKSTKTWSHSNLLQDHSQDQTSGH